MTKELDVSIMVKVLKEIEKNGKEKFNLIWDNDPKHTSNLENLLNKNIVKIDWPAFNPNLNAIENIWSIMKSWLNQISTSKISDVI